MNLYLILSLILVHFKLTFNSLPIHFQLTFNSFLVKSLIYFQFTSS